jgi:hypothetical protein
LVNPYTGISIHSSADEYYFYAAMRPWDVLLWMLAVGAYYSSINIPDAFVYTNEPAGLIRRFIGFSLDFFVALIIMFVPVSLLSLALELLQAGSFLWVVERLEQRRSDTWLIAVFLLAVIGLVLALSVPLSKRRRSAGAIVLGYGLQSATSISLRVACNRTVLGFFVLCLGWISIPIAAFRRDRRMWHDAYYDVFPLKVRRAA